MIHSLLMLDLSIETHHHPIRTKLAGHLRKTNN